MRRLLIAAAALLSSAFLLAACGGTNPAIEEPVIRATIKDLARNLWSNDKDKVAAVVLTRAGQGSNPLGAQQANTAEGRKEINEGNRRNLRAILRDAGIMSDADLKGTVVDETAISRLDSALKVHIQDVNALVTFEIAGTGIRAAELVTFKLQKSGQKWLMYDFEREMKAFPK